MTLDDGLHQAEPQAGPTHASGVTAVGLRESPKILAGTPRKSGAEVAHGKNRMGLVTPTERITCPPRGENLIAFVSRLTRACCRYAASPITLIGSPPPPSITSSHVGLPRQVAAHGDRPVDNTSRVDRLTGQLGRIAIKLLDVEQIVDELQQTQAVRVRDLDQSARLCGQYAGSAARDEADRSSEST